MVVELHGYGARGERHAGHDVAEPALVELLERLVAEGIVAQGTDGYGFVAELTGVIGKVGGGTTELGSLGEHIPQGLSEADDNLFHIACFGERGVLANPDTPGFY